MLADRKQKVKWCLNPRGNDWANDGSKFGQKMLEKMGWAPGKGLGANEQGMKNVLKIGYKSDTKGLGCKEKGEEWIKQQEEFSNFLAELSGSKEEVMPVKQSLEEKSKQTKSRVHYSKFTRGKDLTNYSLKDLSSIIGVGAKVVTKQSQDEDSTKDQDNFYNSIYLKTSFQCDDISGSNDPPRRKEISFVKGPREFGVDEDFENEIKESRALCIEVNGVNGIEKENDTNLETNENLNSKKKKAKRQIKEVILTDETNIEVPNIRDSKEKKVKKKKKKINLTEDLSNIIEHRVADRESIECNTNLSDETNLNKRKGVEDTITTNIELVQRKKKSKRKHNLIEAENEALADNPVMTEFKQDPTSLKKKKKRSKKSKEIVDCY